MKVTIIIGKIWAKLMPYSLYRGLQAVKIRYCLAMYDDYFRKKCSSYGTDCRIYNPDRIAGLENISIGNNFTIGEHSILETISSYQGEKFQPKISIGNNVSFGKRSHIGCINKIVIGDNLLTGSNVLITDHGHGGSSYDQLVTNPKERNLTSKGAIIIGQNVWIGDKASLLAGITIGDNVVIGANSVVTHNIPSNCVACGNPAKIIKYVK